MTMEKFDFAFGQTTQSVMLPKEHILSVLEGQHAEPVDIREATLNAMRNPIGSKPLQDVVEKGDKVCLLVSDITRTWNHVSDFLIYIVDELNLAGIPDEDMFIVFAQGSHRAHRGNEDELVCGKEVVSRIKTYQHDCQAPDLVDMGISKLGTPFRFNRRVCEADKVILVNGITIHLFAGYGGGRKLILPGISSFETIQKNHCHALANEFGGGVNPHTVSTRLDGNELHDDMCEACERINPCFLVHSIVNAEGDVCGMVGGHWYDAWLAGTKMVHEILKAPMKAQADVVFACAGGYPKDISLYQGCKTYDVANMAVKKGGIVIAIMEARDIQEPPIYMQSFRYDNLVDMEKDLRKEFTIPFFVAYTLFTMAHEDTVILVTKPENFEEVKKTGQIPVATVEEAWALAQKKLAEQGNTNYTINVLPHCASVIPVHE